ncbi:FecCD family ABC transporter permease [Alginatibacterium sediminis]|nr:iron ABC transporter permease [Alginatibacterium sediminis]
MLTISQGPMAISFADTLRVLLSRGFGFDFELSHSSEVIVSQIRLPRALLCISIGAILAQCGAVMQGLFRNPLADPGIIGVSSGCAVGAALAIVLFSKVSNSFDLPEQLSLVAVPLASFSAGLVTTLLIYRLGTSVNGTSVTMMLLAGIAISALAGSLIGLMNYLADDQMLRDLSLWQMGSLAGASQFNLILSWTCLVIISVFFQRDAKALNALLLGESEARHLGIDVQALKRRLILLTAFGVGVAVACAGLIGFVGLVVPHLIRLILGPNHYQLIPYSALLGAGLLLAADTVARIVVSPAEMPVGLITAVLGAPFFLSLLLKQRNLLSGA